MRIISRVRPHRLTGANETNLRNRSDQETTVPGGMRSFPRLACVASGAVSPAAAGTSCAKLAAIISRKPGLAGFSLVHYESGNTRMMVWIGDNDRQSGKIVQRASEIALERGNLPGRAMGDCSRSFWPGVMRLASSRSKCWSSGTDRWYFGCAINCSMIRATFTTHGRQSFSCWLGAPSDPQPRISRCLASWCGVSGRQAIENDRRQAVVARPPHKCRGRIAGERGNRPAPARVERN